MSSAVVLDVAGAGEFLGMTEKAIRHRVARRQIPFRRLEGRIVFLRAELEQFLSKLDGCALAEAIENVGREK